MSKRSKQSKRSKRSKSLKVSDIFDLFDIFNVFEFLFFMCLFEFLHSSDQGVYIVHSTSIVRDRKSTRLNSRHAKLTRIPT